MKWINASDITNWAATDRRCEDVLPEIIRRLICATTQFEHIDFPSGKSVSQKGWDGTLRTLAASGFTPSGISGWEMGVSARAKNKAESDYQERIKKSYGLDPNQTTFVFITPRAWPDYSTWQSDKAKLNYWKDVQVFNASKLEQWLEVAPAVALWLAPQIKQGFSDKIRTIEWWWEWWSDSTDPSFAPGLVIGGRDEDVTKIHQWLAGDSSTMKLQGDSPDEVYAFFYAAIDSLPETDKTQVFSRCVLVKDEQDFQNCVDMFSAYPLVIVAPSECGHIAKVATKKGHHVFLAMDAMAMDTSGNTLRLARPKIGAVQKQLQKMGLSETLARQLARDSGHSIPVLRRQLSSGIAKVPSWSNKTSAKLLVPALLMGAWSDNRKGDQLVVEKMSGLGYEQFVKDLSHFLAVDDAPIRKVGSVWMIKSPLDAWFILSQYVDKDSLKIFQQSLNSVLGTTNPKYDLPTDKRWAAGMYGKPDQYSEWLRTGLVESLVLLGVHSNHLSGVTHTQEFVDTVVGEILSLAKNWKYWASLKEVTPLLAEASPEVFLQQVDQTIKKNPKIFQELVQDDDSLFGECRHSGLLWALESLAWSSDYISDSVAILLKLTKIDLGGKWSNRPGSSLKDIFLPGLPQTYATPEERLEIFDVVATKEPKIVWEFAKNYYIGMGGITESYQFRWRDAGGQRGGLEHESIKEHRKYLRGLVPKLNKLATEKENIVFSFRDFSHYSDELRDLMLKEINKIKPTNLIKEDKKGLLHNIRGAMHWISSYGDKNTHKFLPALAEALSRFEPKNVIERVGWLLSTPWPELPYGEQRDYKKNEIVVKKAQQKAARELLDNVSIDKILAFASTINYPGVLGNALASAVKGIREDGKILDTLIKHIDTSSESLIGYASGRIESLGFDWIITQIKRTSKKGNYSPGLCALLHLALPETMKTWTAIAAYGKEAESAYWGKIRRHFHVDRNEDATFAIKKLLKAKRPVVALHIAGDPKVSISSILLSGLLKEFLELGSKERKIYIDDMSSYYLGHIFRQLYERNELSTKEIAMLEWPFASISENMKKYTSSSLAIHRVLQEEPSFFVQLVTMIYKPDDNTLSSRKGNSNGTKKVALAENAWKVLQSWRLLPGLNDDDSINEEKLMQWVRSTRELCAQKGYSKGGDLEIANVLARAPGDIDGNWPHVAVRNLIELLENDLIDKHIAVGIYNSRGIVSRSLQEGGRQERELAAKYKGMSNSIKTKWPRTAAILHSLSQSYERDAKREDVDSDLRDLR